MLDGQRFFLTSTCSCVNTAEGQSWAISVVQVIHVFLNYCTTVYSWWRETIEKLLSTTPTVSEIPPTCCSQLKDLNWACNHPRLCLGNEEKQISLEDVWHAKTKVYIYKNRPIKVSASLQTKQSWVMYVSRIDGLVLKLPGMNSGYFFSRCKQTLHFLSNIKDIKCI